MAKDIKIIWDSDFAEGDLGLADGDFTREEGLETAVMMSLFTDARADIDDPLPDPQSENRKGWWGDKVSDIEDDVIGSKLWLLDRSKTDDAAITDAKAYIEEALQWMIDDEVVIDFDVIVERQQNLSGTEILAFQVIFYKKDGTTEEMKFDDLWQAQFA